MQKIFDVIEEGIRMNLGNARSNPVMFNDGLARLASAYTEIEKISRGLRTGVDQATDDQPNFLAALKAIQVLANEITPLVTGQLTVEIDLDELDNFKV